MRGSNGAPADSGGGGELCKSTSDMCEYDECILNMRVIMKGTN